MISACENTDVCGTRIAFQASVRAQRYKASSVIRGPASSVYIGGGKNCLRSLWLLRASLVRPQAAPSPRLGVWRPSDLLEGRDPAYRLQEMRQGEAGEAGLARTQSVLQQTLRLLRGTALPSRDYQGHCQRNASGLVDGQEVRDAVHEGTAPQSGEPSSQGDRNRRDLDSEGTHVPDRGQRSAASAANLVRRQGPLRKEHGRVLQVVGTQEEQADSTCGHGHVESVPQLHPQGRACVTSRHFIRQVPRLASPWQSLGHGTQKRVCPADGQRQAFYQGPEVYAVISARKPHDWGTPKLEDVAEGQ